MTNTLSLAAAAGALLAAAALTPIGTSAAKGGLTCEIVASHANGLVTLEAIARADAALTGSYVLHVAKSGQAGSADIAQSGEFSAGADAAVTLGSITLDAAGSGYVARLSVTTPHGTSRCERSGGSL